MAVWYLDNDDEITDAVARLRNATDERVVFVVPPGSRIATGRINFRLLAREAESRNLAIAIASPDEQVRALAASAGVLVAVTPDLAEAALERGETAPEPGATAPEPGEVPAAAPTAAAVRRGATDGARTGSRRRLQAMSVVMIALVVLGGYAAWRTLPTAEVALTPHVAPVGPLEVPVRASAATEVADVEAGLVPAEVVPISLAAEGEYPASGTEVTETKATGSVVFSAPGEDFEREIAAGTRVFTADDVAFATTARVVLPPTAPGTAEVSVAIEAVEGGETGNVEPGTVSVVTSALAEQGISVTNPDATGGGSYEEHPLVLAEDYEAAVADLDNRLQAQRRPYLDDPGNTPSGLTLFPESAAWERPTLDPEAAAVVGTRSPSFTLGATASGSVLAIDEALVEELLRERLVGAVPAGMELLGESVSVDAGEGVVQGEAIAFPGAASGRAATRIDREALLEQLAGLPVSEAQAILDALGSATVNVWPGFLGDLPDDRGRITLEIHAVPDTE